MLRQIGSVLTVVGVLLFVLSFIHVISMGTDVSCVGNDCFQGEGKWIVLMPASIIGFVGGVLLISFGGRGFGSATGPRTFEQVDSGEYGQATARGGDQQ